MIDNMAQHKSENDSKHISGQIIATSHDLTPKGSGLEGKSPYFREI